MRTAAPEPDRARPVDCAARWARVESPGADTVQLTENPAEVRWLTGFSGSAGSVLADFEAGTGTLFTDPRYGEQARAEVAASRAPVDVRVGRTRAETAAALGGEVGRRAVMSDPRHMSVARWQDLCGTFSRVNLGASPIEAARRRKDAAEIDRIRIAAAIATRALRDVVAVGLEGRRERDVARLLEEAMVAAGAEGAAYPTIVAAGPNSARPHHRAGDRVIDAGDAVVIDVGARVDGYCSDMTRTFFVGAPGPALVEMHEIVRAAQSAGTSAVRAGIEAAEVDRVCRAVFDSHGMGEWFVHGTGHGVGLEIHEAPLLAAGVADRLMPDEVVTVEPGLYREGLGGVRIEDLVVVTREGARNLTDAPKDP